MPGRTKRHQLGELRGRRRPAVAVRPEISRSSVEHGAALIALTIDEEGQARTAEHKVAVAERLIDDLTGNWGMRESDIIIDCLTFTDRDRPGGVPRRRRSRPSRRSASSSAATPTCRPRSGCRTSPSGSTRRRASVLNSAFLHECVKAGLDSAIVHAARILPISRIPEEQYQVALDLIYDRRRRRRATSPGTTRCPVPRAVRGRRRRRPRRRAGPRNSPALPLFERLERRIVDGERNGLTDDLDEALSRRPALDIVNDTLLSGMKTVGELFGSGQMQLPFVLQSAEVMKAAVAHLEPHMERVEGDESGKGTIVLATVKGDVHDIGKNLVDIILSNNGYTVVNLGIKQPISAILDAAEEHNADAIGMSGLLVKSTVVMKENLEEMNQRGVAARWPVLLGGAALTRAYVEDDLAALYEGEVRYARDAFEGLRLMDAVASAEARPEDVAGRCAARAAQAARVAKRPRSPNRLGRSRRTLRRGHRQPGADAAVLGQPGRSRASHLADYAAYLDERATFLGQWGLRGHRGGGPSYEELVETEGRPRLRMWLDRLHTEGILEAAVVYGYWPGGLRGQRPRRARPLTSTSKEIARFTFPRQRRDRRLCLADFFRPARVGRARRGGVPPGDRRVAGSRGDGEAVRARTPTATTWSCTGCRSSSPRRWRSTGTPGCGRSWASAARTPTTLAGILGRATAGRGTRSAIRPARTWPTGPKLVRLLEPERIGVDAVRGAPAASRAVHRRAGRPPPRGQVLQRDLTERPPGRPRRLKWHALPFHKSGEIGRQRDG